MRNPDKVVNSMVQCVIFSCAIGSDENANQILEKNETGNSRVPFFSYVLRLKLEL